MSKYISIALVQDNFLLGDVSANLQNMLVRCRELKAQGAQLVVFSELALTGYPATDLLLSPTLPEAVAEALVKIKEASQELAIAVGFPLFEDESIFNAAAVFYQGQCLGTYKKRLLSKDFSYAESHYFTSGSDPLVVELHKQRFAILLGTESTSQSLVAEAAEQQADLILNLTAEPFIQGTNKQLFDLRQTLARQYNLPIVVNNFCGAQDETVFAGGSYVLNQTGELINQLPKWQAATIVDAFLPAASPSNKPIADLYQALVFGLQEYLAKNGFKKVVLGLSGGIDSALTLAIAVDAVGASNVRAVMMPFTYTADISKADAAEQAELLKVKYSSLSIEPIYNAFMQQLADEFQDKPTDLTEQNLQARCRGTLLMALSNKNNELVLTTSNKSEIAVGYTTLYGDMVGGFAVLKDVYKTQVYELSRYRNTLGSAIPERVITREPSAELAPDQRDLDNLPAYDQLDGILLRYLERNLSAEDIIAEGFNPAEVNRVLRLVDLNEYKRRQAAQGLRLTQQGFGRERNFPMTGLKHR